MRIALFCSSRHRIPALKTGGMEQPIYYLARDLAKRGHKVVVYAGPGSKIPGVKISIISPPIHFRINQELNIQERIYSFYDLMALSDFFKKEATNFDIIQFNNYLFHEILPFINYSPIPVIIRVNYPHDNIYGEIKKRLIKNNKVYYVPISCYIIKKMPGLIYEEPIYPGVDLKDFRFSAKPDDYLLYIGRIRHYKGVHLAIEAARKSGNKLIIAGKTEATENPDYYNRDIEPYINNRDIIYLGEVDYRQKIKLYQKAKATLFPILCKEAFGNTMIESMACGTPVIAFNRASCPEAIKHNQSGLLVRPFSVAGLISAIGRVNQLDRAKVRQWVEQKFSMEIMVNNFEKLYSKALKKWKK